MSDSHLDYTRTIHTDAPGKLTVAVSVVTLDAQGDEQETTDYALTQALQAILAGKGRIILDPRAPRQPENETLHQTTP